MSGPQNGAGLYTTNAPAYTTWTIQNPDGASSDNRLWITEQRDGSTRNFEYTYTAASNRWDLLEPDGLTTISTWAVPSLTDATITNQFRQVSYGGAIVQQSQKEYQYIAAICDALLLQEVDGVGATTSTTTYTYYPNSNTDGTANLLQRIDYPDGNWVYYQYDSSMRKVTEFSAYGNNPPPTAGTVPNPLMDHCQQTTYAYSLDYDDDGTNYPGNPDNLGAVCKTITSIPVQTDGIWALQEVSRSYAVSSSGESDVKQCVKPGALWTDPSNLETTTSYLDRSYPDGLHGISK